MVITNKLEMDSRAQIYYNYFNGQRGGAYYFQGRRQDGDGLGDVLRGFWKNHGEGIIRAAKNVASGFLSSASQGLSEGKSMKDVLKGTIKPTLTAGLASGSDLLKQSGSGPKRRRGPQKGGKGASRAGKTRAPRKRAAAPSVPPRRVYKRGSQASQNKRLSRKLNFIPNF